jgi:hypothetical protein
MCVSKESSAIAFILGTIINLGIMQYFKTDNITIICVIWQWVLFMQLAEYFIWSDQNCGKMNEIGTKMAMILNITQPIIVYIVGMFANKSSSFEAKSVASVAILYYICYMFLKLNRDDEYLCTKPSMNCSGLNLSWWGNVGYQYFIVIAIVMLSLLQPLSIALFSVVFISIALFVSYYFYSCNMASMWCFFVVPFPLFLGIFYKYFFEK